ncbi:hypothetical protein M885DRAFT_518160 [Pelagophyceae sp. CCMP2097]|nr:hypothetical protein M885DRAFT_518160 [Pelagophyceae sp. CCMP2097]
MQTTALRRGLGVFVRDRPPGRCSGGPSWRCPGSLQRALPGAIFAPDHAPKVEPFSRPRGGAQDAGRSSGGISLVEMPKSERIPDGDGPVRRSLENGSTALGRRRPFQDDRLLSPNGPEESVPRERTVPKGPSRRPHSDPFSPSLFRVAPPELSKDCPGGPPVGTVESFSRVLAAGRLARGAAGVSGRPNDRPMDRPKGPSNACPKEVSKGPFKTVQRDPPMHVQRKCPKDRPRGHRSDRPRNRPGESGPGREPCHYRSTVALLIIGPQYGP